MAIKRTTRPKRAQALKEARETLVASWVAQHGMRLSGEALWRALGFGSRRTFDRAAREGRLPVQIYPLPIGRGRFARTEDVADWIWKQMEKRRKGGDAQAK